MEATTVLGTWTEDTGERHQSEALLRLKAEDIFQSWRRCSLTADFLARYYSYYFPYREKATDTISRETAENNISYILNELIENTAKYSDAADKTVEVAVRMRQRDILFQVTNKVTEKRAEDFVRMAGELMGGNTEQLYLTQLEKEADSSGLGYLTMINDYGVTLGFKVEKGGDNLFSVAVQASMFWKEA
jgi:hypothetical protein